MANMTGGEVHYLRRVKTGDYEHKEFASKISWSAADGDSHEQCEALHERAAAHAVRMVHHHLGLPCPDHSAALEKVRAIAGAAEHAPLTEPAPRQRLHEIVNGLPKKQKLGTPVEVKAPEHAPEAAPVVEADPLLDTIDAAIDEMAQPVPAVIPIADMTAAVHKKFGANATPEDRAKFPAFKLGLPRFAPQISAIAEEKRHEFMTWLESL